jgi:hypothetical protein
VIPTGAVLSVRRAEFWKSVRVRCAERRFGPHGFAAIRQWVIREGIAVMLIPAAPRREFSANP